MGSGGQDAKQDYIDGPLRPAFCANASLFPVNYETWRVLGVLGIQQREWGVNGAGLGWESLTRCPLLHHVLLPNNFPFKACGAPSLKVSGLPGPKLRPLPGRLSGSASLCSYLPGVAAGLERLPDADLWLRAPLSQECD